MKTICSYENEIKKFLYLITKYAVSIEETQKIQLIINHLKITPIY